MDSTHPGSSQEDYAARIRKAWVAEWWVGQLEGWADKDTWYKVFETTPAQRERGMDMEEALAVVNLCKRNDVRRSIGRSILYRIYNTMTRQVIFL